MRLLSFTGALHAYHRLRNRNALTVISLHRVLPEDDPRWPGADPLYTVSARFFDQLLSWLPRHYSVVSLHQIEAARAGGEPLPARPLLITFDDGWADNAQHALPLLLKHALPAVLFCAGDAIDRSEGFFQERLIAAWRAGRLGDEQLRQLWRGSGALAAEIPDSPLREESLRRLISRLQSLEPAQRAAILEAVRDAIEDHQRQMITTEELRLLAKGGFAVGTHGKQHEPLTRVADLHAELCGSRRQVALAAGVPEEAIVTLSFPFSKQDARVVAQARDAGYRLMFGGGLSLTPLAKGLPDLVARVGITAGPLQDSRGNLRQDLLAGYLFRRPIARLEIGRMAESHR